MDDRDFADMETEDFEREQANRRSKMLDVIHTLSVIQTGRAYNVDLSARACISVLDSVLPSPPKEAL